MSVALHEPELVALHSNSNIFHQKWKEIIDIVCKAINGKSWGTNSEQNVSLS